ncbi:hypothetical protein BDW75DRAFT_65558 [Aspergillus navahoensis]
MRDTSDVAQTQINTLHRSAFSTVSSDEPPTADSAVFYTRQVLTHTLLYLHGLRHSKLPLHPGQEFGPINGIDGIARRSRSDYHYEIVNAIAYYQKVLCPSPPWALGAQNSRPVRRGASALAFLLLIVVVCSVLRPAPKSGAGMCRIRLIPRRPSFSPYPP